MNRPDLRKKSGFGTRKLGHNKCIAIFYDSLPAKRYHSPEWLAGLRFPSLRFIRPDSFKLPEDMRFSFYTSEKGTRPIKILQYLLGHNSPLLQDIAFVLNDNLPHPVLKETCEKTGVPLHEIDLSGIEKNERGLHISNVLLEVMTEKKADYLFIFTKRLLKGKLLDIFQNKIINFHPSLLPSFKGCNAIDRALQEKAFIMGNTAHFIDRGIDTGPVIMQSILPRAVYKDHDDVLDQQIPMILQIMHWLKDNRVAIQGAEASVKDGRYQASQFIPDLEIGF